MTKPGPSVTSGADTQPGSDSLFPSGFGGGAAIRTGGVGTSEIADGSVAAADLNLASVAAAIAVRSEMTATYANVKTRGNRVVALGDSQTIASDVTATGTHQNSWLHYAAILSKQQIYYARNAGVSGNTSAQMLARFDTDVTPYAPNVVTLLAGRNDINGSVSLVAFQSNMHAIVAKVRAIGALPVLCTVPPTTSTNGIATTQWNQWIRLYAASIGAPLLDFYSVLVDPATGSYLSAYDSGDHIHPNSAGYFALGSYAAATLAGVLPICQPPLPMDGADTSNLIGSNCCFTTTTLNGNQEPSGLFLSNNTSMTASVITGDAAIKGNWYRMTFATSASQVQLFKTGYAVTPGHTYIFTGRIKSALSAGNVTAQVTMVGASPAVRYAVFQDANALNGIFNYVHVAPVGATSLQVQFTVPAGATGTVDLAQLGLYDATALGIDSLLPEAAGT